MISLDQILLLQQKVESAVEKISQLQAENDALRTKCSELSNSLSRKTEQLSKFEDEQKNIESGILHALEKLNLIENTVLNSAEKISAAAQSATPAKSVQTAAAVSTPKQAPQQAEPVAPPTENETEAAQKQNGEFDIF